MTVSSTTNRWTYTGNGVTTAFAYTNRIFDNTDLKVYVDGALKTLTTHYTVSGVDNPAGGNVTFGTAPANGASVVIVRDVPATQPVDYVANDPFPAETHEEALDRATVLIQQLESDVARTLRQSDADTSTLGALPDGTTRAGKYLGFDASGNPTTNTALGAWKGNWATATAYIAGDMVIDGAAGADTKNVYVCVTGHTSGTWATDLAASKWSLAVDYAQLVADAIAGIGSEAIAWHIEYPYAKTYTLMQKCPFACDITEFVGQATGGTSVAAKLQINGVDVTGSSNTFDAGAEESVVPSAAYSVAAGDTISLVISTVTGNVTDFAFNLKLTRT